MRSCSGGGGLSLQEPPRVRARSRTLDKLWGVLQRGFKRPDHLASSPALLALAEGCVQEAGGSAHMGKIPWVGASCSEQGKL